MKHYKSTQDFYNGVDWALCKAQVMQERMKDGAIYCEHCGGLILKSFNPKKRDNKRAMVFHHKIYLTNENVNDASISINPENIQILHWACHNEIHERFSVTQRREKKVYLIIGAPCSGKADFIKKRVQDGDIVLNVDDIRQCVSGLPRFKEPKTIKNLIFNIRSEIKKYIANSGFENWRNAYIVESRLYTPIDRAKEAERYKRFNVEVIIMDVTREECLERLYKEPNGRDIKEYENFINEYYDNFINET